MHTWSIASPAERLWWGLTNPEAIPHWLGRLVSGGFVAGGVVTIEHADDYSCTSHIDGCVPGEYLSMTWQFPDEARSHVRIMLKPSGGTTSLVLEHEELGPEALNYLHGWHVHLLYLEALLLGQPKSMDEFWSTYKSLVGDP
ncbi:SRPBCC domain-containing protein [uncultured Arthrobacter sp.]|uniref:SRPBCC domain-containing protein n=1 Tax=uncultured Arthrobacter sp. TaxID=114050 RepID=UPI002616AF47|nr:SRPBCC domain-containing protein [uncultured Arthrobacter sp.]